MKTKKRKTNLGIILLISIFLILSLNTVSAWCCEKTVDGAWCQNMENEADCDASYESVSTSCEASSYCRTGTCIDSNNGFCTPNTPERTCDEELGGSWSAKAKKDIPQCQLGCCLTGEQASFVTQVRCEKLASDYGQESDYRAEITDETTCLASANPSEKGACVFTNDKSQRDCEMITREKCQEKEPATALTEEETQSWWDSIFGGGKEETPELTELGISFYAGFLCSAEELNTICGPRGGTECGENGKVYFKDTCGNLANIYDNSKIDDVDYWTYMREADCTTVDNLGNKGSATCGDCDYLAGSTCKQKKVGETVNYGNFICRNLDCLDYTNEDEGFTGEVHPKHGETWCAKSSGVSLITATRDETGTTFSGGDDVATDNLPGSEYYTKKCYNGEVTIEKCGGGYRTEVCVQSDVDETEEGVFRDARCKKTQAIDCVLQNTSEDCENIDERDCKWMETGYYFSSGGLKNKTETEETKNNNNIPSGICVPRYPFGFDISSEDTAENGGAMCPAASSMCVVTYEVGITETWMLRNISALTLEQKKSICKTNCHCLPKTDAELTAGEVEWQTTMNSMCVALGDCGNKNNLIGRLGQQSKVVFVGAAPGEEETTE